MQHFYDEREKKHHNIEIWRARISLEEQIWHENIISLSFCIFCCTAFSNTMNTEGEGAFPLDPSQYVFVVVSSVF